jgi:hypothetical protein
MNNKTVSCYYLGRQISFEEFSRRKVELVRVTNAEALKPAAPPRAK